jgi:hypothetical protein
MDVGRIGWVNMSMHQPILLILVLGGGCLRAADTFLLDDKDVDITTPSNGGLHNFHIGDGAVIMTLVPNTKGQTSKLVDVPLADTFV